MKSSKSLRLETVFIICESFNSYLCFLNLSFLISEVETFEDLKSLFLALNFQVSMTCQRSLSRSEFTLVASSLHIQFPRFLCCSESYTSSFDSVRSVNKTFLYFLGEIFGTEFQKIIRIVQTIYPSHPLLTFLSHLLSHSHIWSGGHFRVSCRQSAPLLKNTSVYIFYKQRHSLA